MILRHYQYLPCDADHHSIIDDFGNELRPFEALSSASNRAWACAYRFAKGQSFDQAGMHSAQEPIAEH